MQTVNLDDAQRDRFTAVLSRCPLFRALKPEHFPQVLKAGETVTFEPGESVVSQGDAADSFFVILEGEAAIQVRAVGGDAHEIGRVSAPSAVGEVALLLEEPRTASVVAVNDLSAVRFSQKAFDAMFTKIPAFGAGLSRGLAHRLQQVSAGKIPLPDWDRSRGLPKPDVLKMIPLELQQRHRVVPLHVDGNVLTLGIVDDPSPKIMSMVRQQVPSLDIRPVRIPAAFFDDAQHGHSGITRAWVVEKEEQKKAESPRSPRLDAMLERMVAEGASDLHLSAGHKPHWRIHGDMGPINDLPVLGPNEVFDLISPVMEDRHREQFLADSDVDLGYTLPGVARFRVNVFKDQHGVGSVMRQIPSKILTLDQLGMPPVLKSLCEIPKGLILVTGPTGSGKSTTLAAMIDHIKKNKKAHIITLEDPIEFVHESGNCLINQREVGGHTKSFARALKAALREDPDIVLVGEMRDLETISMALETANTGHLVFATLHTNNAISAVDRIVDQFPGDMQSQIRTVLSDVLRGVVAQTLLKKTGGGRIPVLEILVTTLAVSNLIREQKTNQLPSTMQASRGLGMQLMNDELARMIDAKKITFDEGLAAAVDKEDLAKRFRSGVTLAPDPPANERLRVMAVAPGSPGSMATLQRGDYILEIDKRQVKDMDFEDARTIFRTDGRHEIWVERSGKRVKLLMDLSR